MTMVKTLFVIALIGHIICFICDLLLIFSPSGRFNFKVIKDNEKMSAVLEKMPSRYPMISMVLGVFAITMMICGYIGICEWMGQFSRVYQQILYISAVICFIPMTAHHVFCGTAEWFYIKLGRTEKARLLVLEFFKKTSPTMIMGGLGLIVFAAAFFIAVVSGSTALPRWGCVFNTIPLVAVLQLLKAPGASNLAGAIMFTGLLFLI